jgi:hypothetical protein
MGGHNIDGVTIQDCVVREAMYGDVTHVIYLSGGHWNGCYPPMRNINIIGNEVCYAGGRHCIQLNGRFENVRIKYNKLYHGELAGLSLIGVQNCVVEENEIYGNNRQAIVIYDYKDGWYDPNIPETVQAWLTCHHPNQNILIRKNTIVLGPHQYKVDPWHNNDPKKHTAVLINNEVHPEIGCYPPKDFVIRDNVFYSPNDAIINFYHQAEAKATRVFRNMIWTTKPGATANVKAPYMTGQIEIPYLEQVVPYWYHKNIFVDPKFKMVPEYPFINLCQNPYYNWADHESESDLYSEIAKKKKKGKTYKKYHDMRQGNQNNNRKHKKNSRNTSKGASAKL